MWCTTSNGTKIYLPKKMENDIGDLKDSFSKMKLSEAESEKDNYNLINYEPNLSSKFLNNINLNFYIIWCIFQIFPIVSDTHYKYIIKHEKYYFVLQSEKICKFTKITTWNIYSSTDDYKINLKFLNHLKCAVKMYISDYSCIEQNIFKSSNCDIDFHLKTIKKELLKHKKTLLDF